MHGFKPEISKYELYNYLKVILKAVKKLQRIEITWVRNQKVGTI